MRRMQLIVRVVAVHFGLIRDLKGKSKAPGIVRARWIAMHLCRDRARATTPEIGRVFGGMDHTTILNACKQIARKMPNDQALFDEVMALHQKLDRIPRRCAEGPQLCARCQEELGRPDPFVAELVAGGIRRA